MESSLYPLVTYLSRYSKDIRIITIHQPIPEDTDLVVLASDRAMAWNSASMPDIYTPFMHNKGIDEALEVFINYNADKLFDVIPVLGIGAGFLHCIHHLTGKIASIKMSDLQCETNDNTFYLNYEGTQFPIKGTTKYFNEIATARQQFVLAGTSFDNKIGGTLWNPSIVEDYGIFESIIKSFTDGAINHGKDEGGIPIYVEKR